MQSKQCNMPSMPDKNNQGWEAFYAANQDRAASPLLRRALGPDCRPRGNAHAVDLGCGAGLETAMLLNTGWDVLAVDKEPGAIARLEALKTAHLGSRLTTLEARFEELRSLPSSALVHAGLSLPFCAPLDFAQLWALIQSSLEPGGVFVGHLFGDRHEWSTHSKMSFHTRREVEDLCSGWTIELLRESEGDGGLVPHHWHRFDLIVRKP
ncbi:Methyltransferase domain-containing protein [Halopseudomonas litoralis]|uniref:Methyltransferase domain-containing protein n=1 Tax=Halopseudomonas litoralis TaxID=797277 RepID=A0A1H1LEI0_9GAMM|nr:methyltransferase domain-containing protein [Halopseudomonas litoralis]SDR72903.1 Methyltransferase domain-containing protein [Halopseudomonas litoralis]